ncbi:MAG: hypothetical protein LWW92_10045 [Rhodocyclales bacterium]|nr:hypothetical protein [Rhodocyclales bacterium]
MITLFRPFLERLHTQLPHACILGLVGSFALNSQAAPQAPSPFFSIQPPTQAVIGNKRSPKVNGTAPADISAPTATLCALNSQAHKRRPVKFSFQEASGRVRNAQNEAMNNIPTGDLYEDCAKMNKQKLRTPNKIKKVEHSASIVNTAGIPSQPSAILGAPSIKAGEVLFDTKTRQLRPPATLRQYQTYQAN